MKYYVIKANITEKGNEDKEIKSFDTYDSALKFYHLLFSNNISAEKKVCAMLTDDNLNVVMSEVWVQPEPEAEETTEE